MHHIEGAQCGLPIIYHEDGGGIPELGKEYGISFRDNVKQALLESRNRYPELLKKILNLPQLGLGMCRLYEELFMDLLGKKVGSL
jgi:hypothetical protein